jgi:hypothetical protein
MSTLLKHAASAVRTVFLHIMFSCSLILEGPDLCALTRPCLRNYDGPSQRQYISDPLLFPSNSDTVLLLRLFISDLVQDLYLKELRGYKAPPAVRNYTPSFRLPPFIDTRVT